MDATDPIFTTPSVSNSFLTDLQAFLRGEDAERYATQFADFVVSGGLHATGAGTTSPAFATVAYVGGYRISQASATINYTARGASSTDVCWVACHKDDSGNVDTFVREPGTHYIVDVTSSTRPPIPVDATMLMRVTLTGGAITAVADLRNGYAAIRAYPEAELPAAGIAGRLFRALDAIGGFRLDTGAHLVTFPGGVVPITDPVFGAHPSRSAAYNSAAIQDALTQVAADGMGLYVPEGQFPIATDVNVLNGCRGFFGPGTLVGTNASTQGIVTLDGPNFLGGTAVDNCYISLNIDCSAGDIRAIFADKATNCTFAFNRIVGITDVNGHEGIRLTYGSSFNRVIGNRISLPTPPLTGSNQVSGITFLADTAAFGDYFNTAGGGTDPDNPCQNNTIVGNVITGGSHGIRGNGLYRSTIGFNVCQSQFHRAIILEPLGKDNTIVGNMCFDWYSSAILLAYVCTGNIVANNVCHSTVSNGQGAIIGYLGAQDNLVEGNKIVMAGAGISSYYGVYLAAGAKRNTVRGNDITGYRRAAVAIESDFALTGSVPAGAVYSIDTIPAPPSGPTWALQDSEDNVIEDNWISEPKGSTSCGIYLAQMGAAYGLADTTVKGNVYKNGTATSLDHQYMAFEENSGDLVRIRLCDNEFSTTTLTKFDIGDRARAHYTRFKGNYGLNDRAEFVAFADGDATPDVSIGGSFQTANTGPTTITNFDGGQRGDVIFVRIDAFTTIDHQAAGPIRTRSGSDIVGASANEIYQFKNVTDVWIQCG